MTRFTKATIVYCSGHESSARNRRITYCLFFCISMVLWNLKIHFISVITLYFNPCMSSKICCIMIMFLFLDRQFYFNDSVTILFFNHVPFGRLCIWTRRLWFENVPDSRLKLGWDHWVKKTHVGLCREAEPASSPLPSLTVSLAFLNTIMRSNANLLSCSNLQRPH